MIETAKLMVERSTLLVLYSSIVFTKPTELADAQAMMMLYQTNSMNFIFHTCIVITKVMLKHGGAKPRPCHAHNVRCMTEIAIQLASGGLRPDYLVTYPLACRLDFPPHACVQYNIILTYYVISQRNTRIVC